jgi:histone demethylase
MCAVQLDDNHVAAWTDLGVLYETSSHFQDAMVCYNNALKACDSPNASLNTRLNVLNKKILSPVAPEIDKRLPGLADAWKLSNLGELTLQTLHLVQQGLKQMQSLQG